MRLEPVVNPLAVYTDLTELDPTPGRDELEAAGWEVRFAHSADPETVQRVAPGAQALLVGDAPITGDLIERLPRLQVIATQSVGTDFIDLDACKMHDVIVANVPDASTEEVASHALAMSLALVRGLPMHDRTMRGGSWDPAGVAGLARLSDLTMGILGLGRIGQRLADMARPLFGKVVGFDPAQFPTPSIDRRSLMSVLAVSDVLSIHLPLNRATYHLLDNSAFETVKPGVRIVNVARGALIDESALLDALNTGKVGAAALDVFESEPPALRSPLLLHDRVVTTPHVAYLSPSSGLDLVRKQARNVITFGSRGAPVSPVAM